MKKLIHTTTALTVAICFSTSAMSETLPGIYPARQTLVRYKATSNTTLMLDLICLKPLQQACEEFELREVNLYQRNKEEMRQETALTEALTPVQLQERLLQSVQNFPLTNPVAGASSAASTLLLAPIAILTVALLVPPMAILLPFALVASALGLLVLPVALVGDGLHNGILAMKRARWKRIQEKLFKQQVIKKPVSVREGLIYDYFKQSLIGEHELE